MPPAALKIAHNDEIRRVKVEDRATFKIESLRDICSEMFGLHKYSICYLDDEQDKISIDSNAEIQEAFRLYPNTLRVTITQSEAVADSRNDANYDTMRRVGIPFHAPLQLSRSNCRHKNIVKRMKIAGVPEAAIRQKLKVVEGVGDVAIDALFCQFPTQRSPPKKPAGRNSLLESIRAGTPLKKATTRPPATKPRDGRNCLLESIRTGTPLKKATTRPPATKSRHVDVMPCLKQRLACHQSKKDAQLLMTQMKLTQHGKSLQKATEKLQQHTQQHLATLCALAKELEQVQRSIQRTELAHKGVVQQHTAQITEMQDETKNLVEQVQQLQQKARANATEAADTNGAVGANFPFATELALLAEMGFTDQKRLCQLLKREDGDVGRVINSPGLFPYSCNPSASN